MQSEQVNELAAALAKAQSAIDNAKKNRKNPHLGNHYADLASVRDAITKPLAANGLAVVQTFAASAEKSVTVETTLLHSSGQWVRSSLTMPVPEGGKQNPAQVLGSVISYARRYALSAIVNISADDDDDASSVSAPAAAAPAPDERIANARTAIMEARSQAELEAIGAKLQKSDKAVRDAVMGVYAEKLSALGKGSP
jgi:hypothetical protein